MEMTDQIQQLTAQLEAQINIASATQVELDGADKVIANFRAENQTLAAQLAAAKEALKPFASFAMQFKGCPDGASVHPMINVSRIRDAVSAIATPSPAADALLEDAQAWRSRLKAMDTYFDSVDEFLAARTARKASTKEGV